MAKNVDDIRVIRHLHIICLIFYGYNLFAMQRSHDLCMFHRLRIQYNSIWKCRRICRNDCAVVIGLKRYFSFPLQNLRIGMNIMHGKQFFTAHFIHIVRRIFLQR